MTNIVDVKEVIANFLTANKFKGFDFAGQGSKLEEKLIETLNYYRSLSENELSLQVSDKVRRRNLLEQSWTVEKVPLKYIGAYPRIGDLPREWCQSSIIDTTKFIRENENNKNKHESIRRVLHIQPHVKVIMKYLYPILLPGGEIRKSNQLLSLPFDSDDGNHRLIAAALSGMETTLAYVGIP